MERTFIKIPVAQLDLDRENPRFPEELRGADDKEILNWMLADATLLDLMASIAENGFFEGEPIIVLEQEGKDRFTVLEGNRRLASITLLQKPYLAKESAISVNNLSEFAYSKGTIPTELWVYICQSREEVDNYLGFRHVTGVKSWPLISKARYLHRLYEKRLREGKSEIEIYRQLAREIGSKAPAVRRLLHGYYLYQIISRKSFFGISNLDESNFDLSLIMDAATKYPHIAAYMGINPDADKPLLSLNIGKLEEVVFWLYEKVRGKSRLGESRNLTYLNQVLKSEDAKQAFLEGKSLEDAYNLTYSLEDILRYHLDKAYNSLQDAQRVANRSNNPEERELTLVDDIISIARTIERTLYGKSKHKFAAA